MMGLLVSVEASKGSRPLDVGDVSAGQLEGAPPVFLVDEGADFRCATARAIGRRLGLKAHFLAPLAERRA